MSANALTPTTTNDDGKFIRTAIVAGGDAGSVAIVDSDGNRLALLNLFFYPDTDSLIVDVIDVDERYNTRAALTFNDGQREFHNTAGKVVSTDFRNRKEA